MHTKSSPKVYRSIVLQKQALHNIFFPSVWNSTEKLFLRPPLVRKNLSSGAKLRGTVFPNLKCHPMGCWVNRSHACVRLFSMDGFCASIAISTSQQTVWQSATMTTTPLQLTNLWDQFSLQKYRIILSPSDTNNSRRLLIPKKTSSVVLRAKAKLFMGPYFAPYSILDYKDYGGYLRSSRRD